MPIETVRASLPENFLIHAAESVAYGYATADEMVSSRFTNPLLASNAIPWNRRVAIEQRLSGSIPDALKNMVNVELVQNSWWWHVEITIGPVLFMQATAEDEDSPIRSSNHKERLSNQSQLYLFSDEDSDADDSVGPKLLATLTHGPVKGTPSVPAFAEIRVPRVNGDGKIVGHYAGKIDLMSEFPEAFAAFSFSEPEEVIEDDAFPEFLDESQSEG